MKADRQPKINLLSYQQEENQRKRQIQRRIAVIIAITALLVGAATAAWWSQNQQLKALETENQQLQEQVEELSKVAASAGGISDEEVRQLGSRKALLDKLEEERTLDPEQLEDIYALSVPDITIGKMDIKNGGDITVTAYTDSQGDLINFLEKLENEDFVKEIRKVSSKRNEKTGEISFSLVVAGEVTSE